MTNTSKAIASVIVLLALVWGVISLSKDSSPVEPPREAGPIKIGFIGPLTGDASQLGNVVRVAVETATEEVNQSGGINGRQLEVIYEDGQCSAKPATNAANKLINTDNVTAIIGGMCSSETAAFGPMAMSNKVITISYSSSAPGLSQLGSYFFRDYPSDLYQGKYAAEYVYNTLGIRKVAVVYHISDYGTGLQTTFAKQFTELGGQITATEGTTQEARDYRTQLTKIKSSEAQLIYMPMYAEGGSVAVLQTRELGLTLPILAGDTWEDTKLHKTLQNAGDIRFTIGANLAPEEFKAKLASHISNDQIAVPAPQAYDAVKILALAFAKIGTDPEKLQSYLRELQYDGVSGRIDFDEHGDITTAQYVVKQLRNGGAVEVQSSQNYIKQRP